MVSVLVVLVCHISNMPEWACSLKPGLTETMHVCQAMQKVLAVGSNANDTKPHVSYLSFLACFFSSRLECLKLAALAEADAVLSFQAASTGVPIIGAAASWQHTAC